MAKPKKKLTAAQRAAKRRRKRETRILFINGKQKRVPREPTIDGVPVDEFIRNNADPIWLLQNGMYEELYALEQEQEKDGAWDRDRVPDRDPSDEDLPF